MVLVRDPDTVPLVPGAERLEPIGLPAELRETGPFFKERLLGAPEILDGFLQRHAVAPGKPRRPVLLFQGRDKAHALGITGGPVFRRIDLALVLQARIIDIPAAPERRGEIRSLRTGRIDAVSVAAVGQHGSVPRFLVLDITADRIRRHFSGRRDKVAPRPKVWHPGELRELHKEMLRGSTLDVPHDVGRT